MQFTSNLPRNDGQYLLIPHPQSSPCLHRRHPHLWWTRYQRTSQNHTKGVGPTSETPPLPKTGKNAILKKLKSSTWE